MPDLTNHAFMQYKNRGLCRRLRGDVLIELVFVTDKRTLWLQDEMDDFTDICRQALGSLCSQASAAKVPLSFSILNGRFQTEEMINPDNVSAETDRIYNIYLRQQGFLSSEDYVAARKRVYKVDEAATVFVLERHFRAFARTGDSREYCALTEGDNTHAIAHELLHLFGAVDLYFPYHVYGLTMQHFPTSYMCSYEGNEVDPLTQYLIGWTDTLSPKAASFVQQFPDYTLDKYHHALTLECYRFKEHLLYTSARPYSGIDNLLYRAKKMDPWAEYLLGLCYRDGILVKQDIGAAEAYLRSSGRAGLTIASFSYAQMLLCRGIRTEQERQDLCLILTYSGYDHLQLYALWLACHFTGTVLPKNPRHAVERAVECYQDGSAIRKAADRCLQFYRIAEKLSRNMPALHTLVEQQYTNYKDALTHSDPDLYFMLAQLMEQGVYVKRDIPNAFQFYRVSAEGNNYRACEELARCYQEGIGTPRNPEAARLWRNRARSCRDNAPWDAFCRLL